MELGPVSVAVGTVVLLVQSLMIVVPNYGADDCAMMEMVDSDSVVRKTAQLIVSTAALYDYRLSLSFLHVSDELRWWVKPRSMTWFSGFLMTVYDREQWVQHFIMSKETVFEICNKVRPLIEKKNTRYRAAIPVEIRVTCAIYKPAHGANILTCSELFAIGRSTVGRAIREVVNAINIVFRDLISWPQGEQMQAVMAGFREWCHLPGVQGAIDCTHIHIRKPRSQYAEDYYYHKTGGHSIVAQAVVDSKKRFTDLFIGMPGRTNDMRTLRRSGLYRNVVRRQILDDQNGIVHEGFHPYLLGDKGYPLLTWIMVPYKDDRPLSVLEKLFNKKMRRGRSVVECAFGILKSNWRELLRESDLSVNIMPDVVSAYALLHNLILNDKDVDVNELMQRIAVEAQEDFNRDDNDVQAGAQNARVHGDIGADAMRRSLQTYLGAFAPAERRFRRARGRGGRVQGGRR